MSQPQWFLSRILQLPARRTGLRRESGNLRFFFGLVPFLTRVKPFGSWSLSAPLPSETFLVKAGLVLLLSRWKSVGFSDLLSLFPGLRFLMKEHIISLFTVCFETSFVELSLMFFF